MKVIAPGRAMMNPMADAVPIALCSGTPKAAMLGTDIVPPPMPIIEENAPIIRAIRLCMVVEGSLLLAVTGLLPIIIL